MSRKEILIDDAGWGDLILGVVIGVLKPPDRRYMERRIPVSSFQPPNFENKKYLDDAVKIADEIVEVMRPDVETYVKVCSGYVLSGIRRHLRDRGFDVEKVEITGDCLGCGRRRSLLSSQHVKPDLAPCKAFFLEPQAPLSFHEDAEEPNPLCSRARYAQESEGEFSWVARARFNLSWPLSVPPF